jgi:hypothetical protein
VAGCVGAGQKILLKELACWDYLRAPCDAPPPLRLAPFSSSWLLNLESLHTQRLPFCYTQPYMSGSGDLIKTARQTVEDISTDPRGSKFRA